MCFLCFPKQTPDYVPKSKKIKNQSIDISNYKSPVKPPDVTVPKKFNELSDKPLPKKLPDNKSPTKSKESFDWDIFSDDSCQSENSDEFINI